MQRKKPHEPVASMRQINMRVPAYLVAFIEDERRRLGLAPEDRRPDPARQPPARDLEHIGAMFIKAERGRHGPGKGREPARDQRAMRPRRAHRRDQRPPPPAHG